MYSDVVLELDQPHVRGDPRGQEGQAGHHLDTDLTAATARGRREYKAKRAEGDRQAVPAGSGAQLWGAIGAVFGSWNNPRAITYRRMNNIPADWGTAVNVQAMVFGNMGETAPPASRSRAIRRPARTRSTASS